MSDDLYDKQHVTYDEHTMAVSLHCLRCNEVIAKRREIPSKDNKRITLHSMVKKQNYREIYVELSDDSCSYLPLCLTCSRLPIDKLKVLDAVKKGWEAELVKFGRPQEAIDILRQRTADLQITKVGGTNAR